jgi:PBP1b-binding outer membrane lipoprotein LpoB
LYLERGAKVKKKLGAILISALMLSTIIGGCAAKREAAPAAATTTGQPPTTVSAEKASLQKIDPTTQQGQAELDKGLDHQLQSLDSALDKLDKSMGDL